MMVNTRPTLTHELSRLILSNLSHDEDRKTLLSVCSASRLLRDEGQRVLFRATTGIHWHQGLSTRKAYFQTHVLFLRSILDSPNRLAKYVHVYERFGMAWASALECKQVVADTSRALPFMINLKRLALGAFQHQQTRLRSQYHTFPSISEYPRASDYKLDQCAFTKLISLDLDMHDHLGSLAQFLENHGATLCHIRIPGAILGNKACSDIPSIHIDIELNNTTTIYDILRDRPKIVILSLQDFSSLVPRRIHNSEPGFIEQYHRLRYLAVHDVSKNDLLRNSAGFWSNIVLLKVFVSQFREITDQGIKNASFPRLRVLAVASKVIPARADFMDEREIRTGLLSNLGRLVYVDVVSRSLETRQLYIHRYYRPSVGDVKPPPVEVIPYGYPDYWWQPHEDGISEEYRPRISVKPSRRLL